MMKIASLALLFAVCNCQQLVSLNGLQGLNGINGIHGLVNGNQQYVLVPAGQVQQQAVLRQAVQPIARYAVAQPRVIAAPRPVVYQAPQHIQTVVAAPRPQVLQVARPQVVLQAAPKVYAARSDESYGPPEPYTFGFESTDEQGNSQSRSESADGSGAVKGSYSYTDVDGTHRTVEYIADAAGYRASVRTNEPGTANANPADVEVSAEEPSSNAQQKVAAYTAHTAGRVHQQVYAPAQVQQVQPIQVRQLRNQIRY